MHLFRANHQHILNGAEQGDAQPDRGDPDPARRFGALGRISHPLILFQVYPRRYQFAANRPRGAVSGLDGGSRRRQTVRVFSRIRFRRKGRCRMKVGKLSLKQILPAAVLVLMANLMVAAKVIPPRPFFFDRDVTVNGALVPQGMYKLVVESKGTSARATLFKDGRFVATAHGTWVGHGMRYKQDAVLLSVNPDGTRTLSEIRLAGTSKSILIDYEAPILRV